MGNVGARLRLHRELAGLSQRALAKRANVPSSSVSLVENERVSPSISSLKRLLDALGVSLTTFFSEEKPTSDQVVFRKSEQPQLGRHGVSYRQVGRNLSECKIQMMFEEYEPGSNSGKITLTHDGEEAGIVIEGELELTVEKNIYQLREGDAYLFASTRPHRFHNPGTRRCVIVSACTPPSF